MSLAFFTYCPPFFFQAGILNQYFKCHPLIPIPSTGSFGLVELGTCIRKSGGDYTYVLEAYGGAPGFLYAWLSILFLRPAGGSIMALTCAEYVLFPFFKDSCGGQKEIITKMVAVAVISKYISFTKVWFPRAPQRALRLSQPRKDNLLSDRPHRSQ